MATYRAFYLGPILFSVCIAFSVVFLFTMSSASASSATTTTTTPATWDITLIKKFSGETLGFKPDDFSFHIVGDNNIDKVVPHDGTIELLTGSYSVSEVTPTGFVPADWTIQWSGKLCENKTAENTTITLNTANEKFGFDTCVADNQYKQGILQVEKVIVGTSTSPTDFSFTVNGGSQITFNSDGNKDVGVSAGSYEIVETDAPGYTTTYSTGCSGTIENNVKAQCTITNTYSISTSVLGCTDLTAINFNPSATEDDGSCEFDENGGDNELYLIDGYVWHDANNDGFIDDEEERLEEWNLTLTNGSTTLTTASDSEGHFSFEVPEGAWTLSELVETGWTQVFPTPITYVITVPEDIVIPEQPPEVSLLFPFNLLFNVAQAQITITGGPFNFGNLFAPVCNFTASNSSVVASTTVSLTWDMTGADTVSIDNGIGTTSVASSTDVLVATDVTYVLTAIYGINSVSCPLSISTTNNSGGGGRGGGGGGSSSPRCELFETSANTFGAGEEIILTWESRRGRDMTIAANGVEIFTTTDDDVIDAGTLKVAPTTDTTYELVVRSGSRDDTCELSVSEESGRGGGLVLGEQISIVPTGAPNTGYGGASENKKDISVLLFFLLIISIGTITFYSTRNL